MTGPSDSSRLAPHFYRMRQDGAAVDRIPDVLRLPVSVNSARIDHQFVDGSATVAEARKSAMI